MCRHISIPKYADIHIDVCIHIYFCNMCLCTYMYTYLLTYVYMHTCDMFMYVHRNIYTCLSSHIHTWINTCTYMPTPTDWHTSANIHTKMHTSIYHIYIHITDVYIHRFIHNYICV